MSGPSSSDFTTRRKFLITERQDPLPCCGPPSNYVFAYVTTTGTTIPSPNYTTSVFPFGTTLTISTLKPVITTATANVTGTSGQTVTLGVYYTITPSGTTYYAIDGPGEVIPASGIKPIFATTTFTPSAVGDYLFNVQLKSTDAGATYQMVTLYAQGT